MSTDDEGWLSLQVKATYQILFVCKKQVFIPKIIFIQNWARGSSLKVSEFKPERLQLWICNVLNVVWNNCLHTNAALLNDTMQRYFEPLLCFQFTGNAQGFSLKALLLEFFCRFHVRVFLIYNAVSVVIRFIRLTPFCTILYFTNF